MSGTHSVRMATILAVAAVGLVASSPARAGARGEAAPAAFAYDPDRDGYRRAPRHYRYGYREWRPDRDGGRYRYDRDRLYVPRPYWRTYRYGDGYGYDRMNRGRPWSYRYDRYGDRGDRWRGYGGEAGRYVVPYDDFYAPRGSLWRQPRWGWREL